MAFAVFEWRGFGLQPTAQLNRYIDVQKTVGVLRRWWRNGLIACAAPLLAGCGDEVWPTPNGPLLVLEGDQRAHAAGCSVPVAVQVRTANGPVPNATVSFATGSGSISPAQAVSDAQGIARAQWTLGAGANTATVSINQPTSASISLSGRGVPVAPRGYATVGNEIISSVTCSTHRFVGITRPGLEWNPKDERLTSEVLTGEDLARMRTWNVNTVRVPISQIFWVPTSKRYDPRYPAMIERIVAQARAAGLDVILDLHSSDRGDPDYQGKIEIQQMADVAHSVPFWKDVASRFKDDGGVIFELFNEPNGITWDVWLNGGMIPGGAQYGGDESAAFKKPYQAAGMQQLYDAVRSTGANNLVIAGGTHWGYFLDQLPKHRIKGHNIAYATHPYDYADKQPKTWDGAFGTVAATDPVIITEFGVRTCNQAYLRAVLDYADKHRLSWVAWAWWTPADDHPDRTAAICRFPALISDWNGTPSMLGEVIQSRISSYR